MKKFFIPLILILILTQAVYAADLKMIWWNVKNFFDTTDEPGKEDDVLAPEEYKKKLELVSAGLRSINADIVSFAEIENITVLKDIAYESGYPFYYLIEGNDPRGIDVCLMSKWEINYSTNRDFPVPYKNNMSYKFSRDFAEAFFYLDGMKIYMLLTHLKSDYGSDQNENKLNEQKRNAQAKGMLDIIARIYKQNNNEPLIIIAGDMNTARHTEPLNILEKSGLIILNYMHDKNKMLTYESNGQKSELDYFIINEHINKKAFYKKLKILNSGVFKNVSDHYPLLLELKFK